MEGVWPRRSPGDSALTLTAVCPSGGRWSAAEPPAWSWQWPAAVWPPPTGSGTGTETGETRGEEIQRETMFGLTYSVMCAFACFAAFREVYYIHIFMYTTNLINSLGLRMTHVQIHTYCIIKK